jgi:outer membrane receptor for ferrienterochelin and colicins
VKVKASIIIGFVALSWLGNAQTTSQDSIQVRELGEVVVTATRNERVMGALPMPVSLIPRLQIKTMGSLRLNDVLTEQTGLVVVPQVNGSGNGIQVQGFNPDYTLILVDGEPLIGRNTGSLDLSRVTIGNIRQIEIVKGPSSSLYGSEALAGVINIITEAPKGIKGSIYSRYGSNNTLDLSADAGWTNDKLGIYLFANRYSTDGYSLSDNGSNTVSPFHSYTLNSKITYKFSTKTSLNFSGRYFSEGQDSRDVIIGPADELEGISSNGSVAEWNINPVVTHRFSNQFKVITRFYTTRYQTESNTRTDSDGSLYYHDDFKQNFVRPEINAEYFINEKNILTVGTGFIHEDVQTSRYGDDNRRTQQTSYGFFQYEWAPVQQLSVIAGGRLDHNSIYGSQFSPKLSSRLEINDRIAVKASAGLGFKAPDFRQLYLNFNNTAGGGYTVLGTEIINERLSDLESQNRIQSYLYDPDKIGKLQAERSASINAGGSVKLLTNLSVDVNGFYNSIDHLIESQAVALTISNQTIYSYRNISRAFTGGLESNISYSFIKNFTLSAGYQLLYAKDKDIVASVKAGEVFARDPNTLVTKRLKAGDYFGLYNRSRNTGNIKLFYSDPVTKWEGSVRVIYRGKFGIGDIRGGDQAPSDINSNAILDNYDNFISDYALVNLSVAKTIKQGIRFQLGVDNVFNYKNAVYIPNLPGRLMYASVGYSFSKQQVKSK